MTRSRAWTIAVASILLGIVFPWTNRANCAERELAAAEEALWDRVVQWVVTDGRDGWIPENLVVGLGLRPGADRIPSRFKAYRITGSGEEFIRRLDVLDAGTHLLMSVSRMEHGGALFSYLIGPTGDWEAGCKVKSDANVLPLARTPGEESAGDEEKAFWQAHAREDGQ